MSISPTKIYDSRTGVENILDDGTIIYTDHPLNAHAMTAFNDKDIRSLLDEGFITVKDLAELIDVDELDKVTISHRFPRYQDDRGHEIEVPLRLLQTPKVRELIRNGAITGNPSLKKALRGFSTSSVLALSDPYILALFDSGAITLEQIKKMPREMYDILQMLQREPYQSSNDKSPNPLTANEVAQGSILSEYFKEAKEALEDELITDLLVNGFITPRQIYALVKTHVILYNLKIPAVCDLIKSHKIVVEQAVKINWYIAEALWDKEVESLIDLDIIPLEDFLQLSYEQIDILKIPQVRDYVRTKRFILSVPMLNTPMWNIEDAFTDANIVALIEKDLITPEQVFYMSYTAFKLLQLSTVQELLLAKKITAEDVLNAPYINEHYPVVAAFKNPDIIALINKDLIAPQDMLRISESSHFDTLNDPAARKVIEERVIEGFLEELSPRQREELLGRTAEDFLTELSLQQKIEFFEKRSMGHFSKVLSPREIAQEAEAKQIKSASMLLALQAVPSIIASVFIGLLGIENTPYESDTPCISAGEAESSMQLTADRTREPTADATSFLTPQTVIPLAITAGVCAATAVCFWKRVRQSNEPESRQPTPRAGT